MIPIIHRCQVISTAEAVRRHFLCDRSTVLFLLCSINCHPTVRQQGGLIFSLRVDDDDDDGFVLAYGDFGRMFDNSFPACAFFFLSFFQVEISSLTLIPLFRPGSVHSGSAS